MTGDIDTSDNKIENLGPPAADNKSAINKEWVETKITQSTTGGLSDGGFTMKGKIDMSGHELVGLADPTEDDSAVTNDYIDNNFLTYSGILMEGIIDMNNFEIKNVYVSRDFSDSRYLKLDGGRMRDDAGGYTITNINDTPVNDGSTVNKKYIEDTFAKKSAVLNTDGFTMTGAINMGGNTIYGLSNPTNDTAAVSKVYTETNFISKSGDIMQGKLNMGRNNLIGLPDAYTDESSAVSKKFIENEFAKIADMLTSPGFTMKGYRDYFMVGERVRFLCTSCEGLHEL